MITVKWSCASCPSRRWGERKEEREGAGEKEWGRGTDSPQEFLRTAHCCGLSGPEKCEITHPHLSFSLFENNTQAHMSLAAKESSRILA